MWLHNLRKESKKKYKTKTAMQHIAILGSTGSIGTQTLQVVRANPTRFQVELLTANANWELLARQAIEFQPATVVIAQPEHYEKLKAALEQHPIKVYAGSEAIEQEVQNSSIETVVTAMVGFSGLAPTVAAIKAGKKIALANKETLVVAGELIIPLAIKHKAPIVPVDSEHSAIFQCVVGERSPLSRVIITASGGALRDLSFEELERVTPEQALKHPCWEMGAKITIDSATMVNKGFEVIEAGWLFGLKPEQIDVVIHPESIIHSFVEFEDRALKAQMGCPDMRLPIQYALTFPERLPMPELERYNPLRPLTFKEVDARKYHCLTLAYNVMREGGILPCVMNAANEVAVDAFLRGKIPFTAIASTIEQALEECVNIKKITLEQIFQTDAAVREQTKTKIWKF